MPQKPDSHLWLLRTFHIKTSRHSRWVKSWRSISGASSNRISCCSNVNSTVPLSGYDLHKFLAICKNANLWQHRYTAAKFEKRVIRFSLANWSNTKIPAFLPDSLRVVQIPEFLRRVQKADILPVSKIPALSRGAGIQAFHLRAFISHLIEHLTSHREYPRVKCIFLCTCARIPQSCHPVQRLGNEISRACSNSHPHLTPVISFTLYLKCRFS